ncbi:MAG: hypothetical protein F6J93_19905 [Oscillatoria sp. SIO1A7]|nr:hypothetical protein [Oscillatoria sp. SIO1A7]
MYCELREEIYNNVFWWDRVDKPYFCYYDDGSVKQFNHGEYIVEQFNHQIKQQEKLDNLCEDWETFKGEYDWNVDWNFQSKETCQTKAITKYIGTSSGWKAIIDLIFFLIEQYERLRGIICGNEACVAMPEHYQIKLEGHRPQLVLQLAEPKEDADELGKAQHVITIPHYIGKADSPAPVQYVQKGGHHGMLVLNDNSKIHVYCISKTECTRVLQAIRFWVNPFYLDGAQYKYSEYPTADIKQVTVYPKYAKYWPNGTKHQNSEWTTAYSYDA